MDAEAMMPPCDLDAERALLGSMLAGGAEVMDDVLAILNDREGLYVDAHRVLYDVLVSMHQDRKPIDHTLAVDVLRKQSLFDRIGGMDYVLMLAGSYGDYTRAKYYAEVVKEKWALRTLIQLGGELRAKAFEPIADPTELAHTYADKIDKVRAGNVQAKIETVESLLVKTGDALIAKTVSQFTPTGFYRWDFGLNGLERPALIIGGARPSAGKTSIALRMMISALQAGVSALFVSLEMTVASLGERILVMQTGIPIDDYRKEMPDDEIRRQVQNAIGSVRDAGGHIVGAMKVNDILALSRSMARKGVGIVFVDFLQLCVGQGGKGENRNQVIGSITRAFKVLAMECNLTVVMLSQLGRDSAHNDREPQLTDLRDSGEIEQDADVVFLLSRKEADADQPIVPTLLKVAKNRNGPLLRSPMEFTRDIMQFRETM